MNRYHVNMTTGKPAVCRATEGGRCPFSGAADWHKDSPDEIYSMMEKVNADFITPKPLKRRGLPNPARLQAILDWVNPAIYAPRRPQSLADKLEMTAL